LNEDPNQAITAQKKYKMELLAEINKLRTKYGDNKPKDPTLCGADLQVGNPIYEKTVDPELKA
jgi:hypothetical protein